MYKESYNQRLKEIREKYGSSIKDTISCLKNNQRQLTKNDSFIDGKYRTSKVELDSYPLGKKFSQNVDPLGKDLSRKYSTLAKKEKQADDNFSSFLYTQSKEQRLKEIEKIRQTVAETKKQAIDQWNRKAQKSMSKNVQTQKYLGLRERTNTYAPKNPQQKKYNEFKQISTNQPVRKHGFSFTSTRIESDNRLDLQLKRNYDYTGKDNRATQERRQNDYQTKRLDSYRKNSLNKFDRQIESLSGNKNFACTTSIELKNTKIFDSETTSPIRGLMKLDSLQKTRRIDSFQPQNTLSKFANTTYDLTNIDKIQERIQKILAKK